MAGRKPTGETRVCKQCEKHFYAAAWQIKDTERNQGTYCSRECQYAAMKGRPNEKLSAPMGHERIRSDGYVEVKVGPGRLRLKHRVAMEQKVGRSLATWEHVHHINGNPADNRLENLRLMSKAEHLALHDSAGLRARRNRVSLVCKACGKGYERKASRAAESSYCSAACRMPAMWEARRRKAWERKE